MKILIGVEEDAKMTISMAKAKKAHNGKVKTKNKKIRKERRHCKGQQRALTRTEVTRVTSF